MYYMTYKLCIYTDVLWESKKQRKHSDSSRKHDIEFEIRRISTTLK